MRTALRIFTIAIVAVVAAAWLLSSATAQKRSRNEFFHSTAAHKKKACASCHNVPSGNWEASRGFPDVADYPGHASCVGCHRSDFFAGNAPAICTICHTASGPRNAARLRFPVRSRSREFTSVFPHDVHQDIIARNENPDGTAPAHFVSASFMPALQDDSPPQYNNCAICHQSTTTLPKFGSRQTPRGQAPADAAVENFAPGAGFFKTTPEGHASCFSCHYQGQKPVRTDCAGCHRPAAPYTASTVVRRYSLKFDHQSPNHVSKDCTTCHIRIAQNTDLATMKDADVPFVTCASCHAAHIKEETAKRTESIAAKQPVFQCVHCHSPEIGRFEIPASHR